MAQSTTAIEVWLYQGKHNFLKKTTAKIIMGIVSFKESDPAKPVVWLGQKSYTFLNLATKKNVLLYDTLTGMLFRPSDISSDEDNVDMIAQTSQNVMLGGNNAREALGIQDTQGMAFKYGLAVIVVITVLALVFIWLMFSNAPSHAVGTATTTIAQILPSGIGPNLVPTTTV